MSTRLTPKEKKTILQLHFDGKNIKEIVAETGRSREAITNLFADCGIGDGSYRLESRIWWKADILYGKWRRELIEQDRKLMPSDLRLCSTAIQNEWYKKARKIYMEEAQHVVDSIMMDDAPKIQAPKEDTNEIIIKLLPKANDELDYISNIYGIDRESLINFIITKEYLEVKRNDKIPE